MARISQLETDIFVASQLTEADFADIAALGIRSVVNNRPDGEADDQIESARAEAAARRHGLIYRYLPVTNFDVTDDEPVDAQARLMAELPGPILFYCRTGNRCSVLWAQASARRLGVDTVLDRAARAGYDLAELREYIDDRADALVA
jgi:sulfide:quinone oxidoreductase